MKDIISISQVVYDYGLGEEQDSGIRALNGVTAAVREGEFLVVLGRNGSGKSTLARLMNALLIPQEGTVIVDGMDTQNGELLWDIRKSVGMVFQNPDNQMVATTVEEDVAFGPENLGVPPDEIRSRIDSALSYVGMTENLNRAPHLLSGGQKQRVAIAGILAMAPKCIILDEATSMLDPAGRREVMGVLRKLNREKGITLILITHHMDEAAQAHRVLVMSEGQLALEGTPESLFENVSSVRGLGLEVPQVSLLAHELKHRGISFPKVPIDLDEGEKVFEDLLSRMSVSSLKKDTPTSKVTQEEPMDKAFADKNGKKDNAIIRLRELTHIYMPGTTYEKKALDNVSLTVERGEILGIIGHTGSGKSTLVQHLNGLLKPSSGFLEVDGLKAAGKTLKELRRRVGLIFQYPEHQLFEETVYKDILFGLTKLGLSEEEMKRRIFEVTESLGLGPELLEKSPFELSGGQKRRVAIAGVLVMEPSVLILDEPTAGLDPKGSREVFALLSDLNRKKGTTILIISHNMEDMAAFCHRIAVMHNGRLAACDTPSAVFSRKGNIRAFGLELPSITELFFRLQEKGYKVPDPVLTVKEAEAYLLSLREAAKERRDS